MKKFSKKGFALLYAVLVSSLFLAIGATIASATLQNLIFSQSGRESQFAFYSADSGVECALYWDKIGRRDNVSVFPTSTTDVANPNGIKCNNEVLNVKVTSFSDHAVTTFNIGQSDSLKPYADGATCADIVITKAQTSPNTTITSNGYNTCDTANVRRLQRGLLVTY